MSAEKAAIVEYIQGASEQLVGLLHKNQYTVVEVKL
jgi:hypothetical protein